MSIHATIFKDRNDDEYWTFFEGDVTHPIILIASDALKSIALKNGYEIVKIPEYGKENEVER